MHTSTVRYTAVETLTDGKFFLDVREIGEWAPATTEPPMFRVFAPRYRYYQQGSWVSYMLNAPHWG